MFNRLLSRLDADSIRFEQISNGFILRATGRDALNEWCEEVLYAKDLEESKRIADDFFNLPLTN